ncbi:MULTISPECIES: peptidylprolyl isomerase [Paracoccaceae]|uniref:PpiC domain-containing protein n=1 Tax=Marinibacterium profundimaris TaxID=1679460 RepID=A0A225NDJ9_9RHOB|nr:peptidylprolyl isomerase [Marinibacterium profundimaris]OWU69996.1 hypothetical protein ATO3_21215 [Marinibacterium profundimaris]
MLLRRLARSPLLHFFALGGLIFAAYAVLDDDPAPPPADAIVLTVDEAARLAERFTATWQRPPSEEELAGLLRAWALEEVYVREALALGLDRGDGVIRQRLATKMGFIAESGAAVLEPDDATLRGWLDANADRFRRPMRLAFDQVLLGPGTTTEDVAQIRESLAGGADPAEAGQASLLPPALPLTPSPVIDRSFGSGFSDRLADFPRGTWSGPVESAYGPHLVRVTAVEPASMPPLDEIRAQVEGEWRAEQARQMRESFGEALLERYTLHLPEPAEVLGR